MNIWFLLETFQFFGMNKLWTERIPPSINVTSPSHVAPVHFLLSVSLSTQLLETYVSIIFQQFNILLPPNFLLNKNSFFWASSDMYIVYLLWYQIWYNICRRDTFFHAPAIGSFTARAHMIIKIFTGNFHIFNHLNLIRTHVRMIHFHTRFFCVAVNKLYDKDVTHFPGKLYSWVVIFILLWCRRVKDYARNFSTILFRFMRFFFKMIQTSPGQTLLHGLIYSFAFIHKSNPTCANEWRTVFVRGLN